MTDHRWRHFWACFALVASATWMLAIAVSEPVFGSTATVADETLTEGRGAPWWDPAKGELRPVPVRTESPEAAHRRSDWAWEASQPSTPSTFQWPDWLGEVLKWLIGGVLVALVLAILYWIARFLQRRERPLRELPPGESWEDEKIEELPFELASRPSDFVSAAREAITSGKYRQAVILLYSEQLMHLDRLEWLRLAKGKTNRQYLRELHGAPELRALLRESVWLFEDVYFGERMPTEEDARAMWDRTSEIKERFTERRQLAEVLA